MTFVPIEISKKTTGLFLLLITPAINIIKFVYNLNLIMPREIITIQAGQCGNQSN